jgi:hypothetical protein
MGGWLDGKGWMWMVVDDGWMDKDTGRLSWFLADTRWIKTSKHSSPALVPILALSEEL